MNPPNTVSFMPTIDSTSGRLHTEFVRLLFLQTHRETDRFFETSGVHLTQTDRGMFHYLRTAFSVQIKIKVGLTLCSIFRYSSSSRNPVYESHVDSSSLGFSLSSHRQSYKGLVFSSRFNNKLIVFHYTDIHIQVLYQLSIHRFIFTLDINSLSLELTMTITLLKLYHL